MKKWKDCYVLCQQQGYVWYQKRRYMVIRINGRSDPVSYDVTKRKLTLEEENSVQSRVLKIQAWGFQPIIANLRQMKKELLQTKEDSKKLGKKKWIWSLSHIIS